MNYFMKDATQDMPADDSSLENSFPLLLSIPYVLLQHCSMNESNEEMMCINILK
jgi:hypothetical protein